MRWLRYMVFLIGVFGILSNPEAFAVHGSKNTWEKAKEGIDYRGPSGDSPEEKFNDEADRMDEPDNDPNKRVEPRKNRQRPSEPLLKPGRSAFMEYLGYAAIGIIVVILIILVIRAIDPSLKNKKVTTNKGVISVEENPDELSETELQKILRLALEKTDFKTAVRAAFLMVLENLDRNEVVKWHKHKTNRQYLVEASSRVPRGDFQVLILAYEQVWFGDLVPDRLYYDAYVKMSDNLKIS